MGKRVSLIIILFTMISIFMLNFGQPIKHMAENDGIIEWQSYGREGYKIS